MYLWVRNVTERNEPHYLRPSRCIPLVTEFLATWEIAP